MRVNLNSLTAARVSHHLPAIQIWVSNWFKILRLDEDVAVCIHFFGFVHEVLDCVDIIFASFKPGIIVMTSLDSVDSFMCAVRCCIMKDFCHFCWYNFVLSSCNKKNWNFNLLYPIYGWPKNTLNERFKPCQKRKNFVNHFRYTGESIFNNQTVDSILDLANQLDCDSAAKWSAKYEDLFLVNVFTFDCPLEYSFGIKLKTFLGWLTLRMAITSITNNKDIALHFIVKLFKINHAVTYIACISMEKYYGVIYLWVLLFKEPSFQFYFVTGCDSDVVESHSSFSRVPKSHRIILWKLEILTWRIRLVK